MTQQLIQLTAPKQFRKESCHCPKCTLIMRRVYVNGTIRTEEGKRRTKFVPIGHYCPYCNLFLSDNQLENT